MPKSDWTVAAEVLAGDIAARAEAKDLKAKIALYEALDKAQTGVIPSYKSKPGEAVAVALLSDVHCEERVDPEDVPGTFNIYNPSVCQKRMEQFFQRVVLLTDAHRGLTKVNTLVLAILGDIITGHLHDDQRESNYMSPTKALVLAEEMLSGGIQYILDNGSFDKIIIPCTVGNHGRLTHKPRAKTALDQNLEWLLYHHLSKRITDPRVEWHIASGAHVYLDICGRVCRFHHGDDVRYQGGVGGLSIPLNKAISGWNKVKVADYDFLGHYHQCRDFGNAVVNGSIVGYGAYALRNKCDFEEPKQAYVLIDSKRGKCCFEHIWTDWMPNGGAK